jgi:hypothetical protein
VIAFNSVLNDIAPPYLSINIFSILIYFYTV